MKLNDLIDASRGWELMGRSRWPGRFLVVAAVVLLTACGGGSGPAASSTPAGSHVIPWLPIPGTPLPPTQPLAGRSECTLAQLRNDGVYAGVYQGNGEYNLHLTNTDTTACSFPGVPQMEVTLASGNHLAVSPGEFAAQRVDLQPNQTVQIMFGSPGSCSTFNPQTPLLAQSVQVTFSTGERMMVNGLQLDVQCGAPTVLVFVAEALSTPVSSSPLDALEAAVIAPATAALGSTFTYTVTLTNPTAAALAFSPCPSYTEGISNANGVEDQATWLLNCQVVQQIPAGKHLTFAMQHMVPSSFPVGAAKLFWNLQVPGGPAAGTLIVIS